MGDVIDPKKDPSKKPPTLGFDPRRIPDEIRAVPQWVTWKWEWRADKWTKPLYNARTGAPASVDDPASWSTGKQAYQTYRQNKDEYAGIGIVLTENLGLVAIDLDDCVTMTGETKAEIASWAQDIVDRFPTYWEISPSGTGLRGIGRGTLTRPGRRRGKIEVYDRLRYVTLTGQCNTSNPVADIQVPLDRWHREIWPDPPPPRASAPAGSGTGNGVSDDELLERARNAANGERFTALYDGDWKTILGDDGKPVYPSQSDADLALVGRLLWWTNGDTARVDLLFRQSRLMRDKWVDREDYRERTLAKALETFDGGYTGDQEPADGPTFSYAADDPIFGDVPPSADGAKPTSRLMGFRAARDKVGQGPPPAVVANMLIRGETSLLVAKPGVGKSTLAIECAVCVAEGRPFLGRGTLKGPVIYFAFEGYRATVSNADRIDTDPYLLDENLKFYDGDPITGNLGEWLRGVLKEMPTPPVLMIVDTYTDLIKVRHGALNAGHQETTEQLRVVAQIARSIDCHVLFITHGGKGEREDIEAALGSIGAPGGVDTVLVYKRLYSNDTASPRVLSSPKHRSGDAATDIPAVVLGFNRDTGLSVLGLRESYEIVRLQAEILDAIDGLPDRTAELNDIVKSGDIVKGKPEPKRKAIDGLVDTRLLSKTGSGKKKDPFILKATGERVKPPRPGEEY